MTATIEGDTYVSKPRSPPPPSSARSSPPGHAIQTHHPEIPAVVIVVGSGSSSKKASELQYGHYATLRWQHGDTRLPEVLVSGEGLRRTPAEVLTTLLHEATHALADRRGIQDTSRQGRWHNRHFATLAGELGLTATKDDRARLVALHPAARHRRALRRSPCPARRRHARLPPPRRTRRSDPANNNNGNILTCGCPRKIRVPPKTAADEGPIHCGVCDTPFLSDDDQGPGPPSWLHTATTRAANTTVVCPPIHTSSPREASRLGDNYAH